MPALVRSFSFILFLIICLSDPTLLAQNNQPEPIDQAWQIQKISKFQVFYYQRDKKNAEQVLTVLFDYYPIIAAELGYTGSDTFVIFIAPTRTVFRQLTYESLPDWANAVAVPGKNLMILKSPRWDTGENHPEVSAVHELTHLLLHQVVKRHPIPRWLDEGLAIYYSNDQQYISASHLSRAILTRSIIPLGQIDDVLSFQMLKAQLAYEESYTAARFLVETYGTQVLRNILADLARGKTLDTAMTENLGSNLKAFEADWLVFIQKNYRWTFIDSINLIWLLVPFLFLLGYLLVKIRNRRTLKSWEATESGVKDVDNPENNSFS